MGTKVFTASADKQGELCAHHLLHVNLVLEPGKVWDLGSQQVIQFAQHEQVKEDEERACR